MTGIARDVVTLSDNERAELWLELIDLCSSLDMGELSDEDAVEIGWLLAKAVPVVVYKAVRRLMQGHAKQDALLLRNVIPPEQSLEQTPACLYPGVRGATTRFRELALLGVMTLLGQPFSFSSLYSGRIVQDVVPVPGAENAQTSGSSKAFLQWHVEDAFSSDRCDYFGLLCLRGDQEAVTQLCAAKNIDLDPRCRRILRQSRFAIIPDEGHKTDGADRTITTPVLSGPDINPEICYDSIYMRAADHGDYEADAALQSLTDAIERGSTGYTLEPGDLLIVDNRRVVHARTSFPPRFDGHDRWLMRTMVCSSAPKHRRRGGLL